MQRARFKTGLLQQFAPGRLLGRFAKLLRATRQRPCADIGRLAAADQQNAVVLDDHDADPDDRPGGIFAVAHCLGGSVAEAPAQGFSGGAAFRSSSDGTSAFCFQAPS